MPGEERIYNDDIYSIYKVNDVDSCLAMCYKLNATGWCVQTREEAERFVKRGPLYFILKNGLKYVLAHPASHQAWDATNTRLNRTIRFELKDVLSKIDDIWSSVSQELVEENIKNKIDSQWFVDHNVELTENQITRLSDNGKMLHTLYM